MRNVPTQWLQPNDPPEAFAPVQHALDYPNGLLAAGGDLSSERLLYAYAHGIFPWYEFGQPILWWSPDPRAVLFPDALHVSRSLRKTLHRDVFRVTFDRAFAAVLEGCAGPRRDQHGTWITPAMIDAYQGLHALGHAHSVEVWRDDRLVGGLYGIALGAVFFGESMFSHETDASKVALVHLTRHLAQRGYLLIDCQVDSPHLRSLGAQLVARATFVRKLRALTTLERDFGAQADA